MSDKKLQEILDNDRLLNFFFKSENLNAAWEIFNTLGAYWGMGFFGRSLGHSDAQAVSTMKDKYPETHEYLLENSRRYRKLSNQQDDE